MVGDDVSRAVNDVLPALRASAERCERERRVPDESIELLAEAGAFKILQPKRFGGYEGDLQRFFDVVAAVGGACASTGWVAGVCSTHQWVVANFSERAQLEVWGDAPETLVSATYAPAGGTATPVDGGYRVRGSWSFASGCDHTRWHFVGAAIDDPAAEVKETAFFLMPVADVTFVDNWFVGGLCGTGSKDAAVSDAFVPEHRVVRLRDLLATTTPGLETNRAPLYRAPFFSVIPLGILAPIVGAAQHAVAEFIENARDRRPRGGVFGSAAKVSESPLLQGRVAEASGLLDAVDLMLRRDIAETEDATRSGRVTVDLRIRNRRDYALAVRLCTQVLETLYGSSGAVGMFVPNALERTWRDVHAAGKHTGLNWDNIGAMVGRYTFGQDPRGQH